jgi:hypothetical protein
MINLIITAFGIVLIIGGFYAMSFGFSTPPNPLLFFMGLLFSVLGAILVIMFGSKIESGNLKIQAPKRKKPKKKENHSKSTGKIINPKIIPKEDKKPDLSMKKPIIAKKPQENKNIKKMVASESGAIASGEENRAIPRKIKPKRIPKDLREPVTAKENLREQKAAEEPHKAMKAVSPNTNKPEVANKSSANPPETVKKEPKMRKKVKPVKPIAKSDKNEDEFVKDRLNRLKENYIKNAKDIENLIEERLDSFKGTLDQIKSESKDPSIIWSFDAGEVQETMKDTILKADKRILMMYPWVRNVDVSVLKRFMETESKMIIQEASLDDDASVELIKLLMDNNVEIRTMPHVHTVAIVSDEENGLIISTDPIYESFEVGVIYKDQKSIEEIERMFEEAWNLSQDITLEINQ